ncbi:MAG: hypothetical protein ACLPPF_04120 [Rhodomicrobium sp.]
MISMPLLRRRSLFGIAAGAMLPAFASAHAEAPCTGGLTILTIGGLAGSPNRAPFDATRDRFFDHNNISFQKARTFTASSLSALPQKTVKANNYGIDMVGKGPLLHDIIAAASPLATAKTARLSALDAYAAELTLADIQSQEWILAMEADGRPFAIGNFGPLYAMRQLPPGMKKVTDDEEEMKWVHSLYYIELMA